MRGALAGLFLLCASSASVFAAPNAEIFAGFQSALSSPEVARLRVLSIQPAGGGSVIYEFPPRRGADLERYALVVCDLPLTAKYRSELLDRIASTHLRPRQNDYPPQIDWGIELRDSHEKLLSAIYLSTDWLNSDFTQGEIDGRATDISKPLVKWIQAEFPTPDCQFGGRRPDAIHTFQYYKDRVLGPK